MMIPFLSLFHQSPKASRSLWEELKYLQTAMHMWSVSVKHGYDNIKECPCVGHLDTRIQARYASDTSPIRHVAYR